MHSPTTADVEKLPRQPARLLGGQEDDDVGYVLGAAHAAQRRTRRDLGLLLWQKIPRLYRTRGHDVDRNAVFPDLDRGRAAFLPITRRSPDPGFPPAPTASGTRNNAPSSLQRSRRPADGPPLSSLRFTTEPACNRPSPYLVGSVLHR